MYVTQAQRCNPTTVPQSNANVAPSTKNSERNFKRGLTKLLIDQGIPENHGAAILRYLNSGKDQQIGTKLQAMLSMQPPLLPANMVPNILKLASETGMPTTSLNKEELRNFQSRPLPPDEIYRRLGFELDLFTNKLGMTRYGDQRTPQTTPFAQQYPNLDASWISA